MDAAKFPRLYDSSAKLGLVFQYAAWFLHSGQVLVRGPKLDGKFDLQPQAGS